MRPRDLAGARLLLTTTVLLTATILVGCSAGGGATSPEAVVSVSPTEAPTPAPTPSPSPTPEPTPTSEPTPDLAAIGAAYLAAATALFEGTTGLDDQMADATTDDEISAIYAKAVGFYREGHDAVQAIHMPDTLADAKSRLLASLKQLETEFGLLAEDPAYDPGDKITTASAAITAAGTEIREALGLPPPATPKP